MMIDRTHMPPVSNQFSLKMITPDRELIGETPFYFIDGGDEDVLKIEIIYQAGTAYESVSLQASTVNELIGEGTAKHTAQQINQWVDDYGAFIQRDVSRDHAAFTLFCLHKHLDAVLPFFVEMMNESSFPEDEVIINIKNRKARFESHLQKVEFVCRNEFSRLLFGAHPYGRAVKLDDYNHITNDVLKSFYASHYLSGTKTVFVSGKINAKVKEIISRHWHRDGKGIVQESLPEPDKFQPVQEHISMPNAIQSAIRIGKPMITITHPDYPMLNVANTIFGGYFGSRLMKNIREEKGFTYGIGSALHSFQQAGLFVIATEVGEEYTAQTLEEIQKELRNMHETLVPEEELEVAKNYILGNFLKTVDGPFAQAELIKLMVLKNMPFDFFNQYLNQIRETSSEQVLQMMNSYLKPDSLAQLVVGK